MSDRNKRYRSRRIAAGSKAIYLLLSPDSAAELDSRCADAALSRVQLIEKWLREPRHHPAPKDA